MASAIEKYQLNDGFTLKHQPQCTYQPQVITRYVNN